MATDHPDILAGRNRHKKECQVYIHEAEQVCARNEAAQLLNKKSASLFFWASGLVVLGLLGHKFEYMSEKDRRAIMLIRNEIDKRVSHKK